MLSTNFLNKVLIVAMFCVICGTGCSVNTRPDITAVPDRDEKPVAVFPVENLSRQTAPLAEMRQALIKGMIAQGVPVLADESLEVFMKRHRVRYVGGVDTAVASALKDELGIDAVLITTLEQYAHVYPPKIALTVRLVSIEGVPRVLWIESIGLSGDDSPGLFGLGYISELQQLQNKALDQMTQMLAGYFSDKGAMLKAPAERRYNPKIAYLSRFMAPDKKYNIAVAPFLNKSKVNNAGEIMALHFIDRLAKIGDFDILDPGVVRERFLKSRMIMPDGFSLADIDLLLISLDADFVLSGKVLTYQDNTTVGQGIPRAEFNVIVFERKDKRAVWASQSYNGGMDGVFFFDWGQARTAGVLVSRMAGSVIQKMTQRDPRLLDKTHALSRGPWASMVFPQQ